MKIGIFYLALIVSVLVYLTIKPMMKSNEIGSEGNPIRILLTPSVDAQKLSTSADSLVAYLEAKTGYHVVATFPTSFIAVVEAFGSGKADIAAMNTFSYILAHQKYGVKAALKVIRRDGETTYRGQFIAKANSDIHSIQDLRGKKIAFVDAASTSGYILPKAMLDKEHIKPAEEVFAMRHDNVVTMVYQSQVDAGATYYSPPDKKTGEILDARARVAKQYPDIFSTVKIVGFTESIPNDPFVFRSDFPENMKRELIQALLDFQSTPAGRETLYATYSIEGLAPTTDKDYDVLRTMIKAFGGDLEKALKKK